MTNTKKCNLIIKYVWKRKINFLLFVFSAKEVMALRSDRHPCVTLALIAYMPRVFEAVQDKCITKANCKKDSKSFYVSYNYKKMMLLLTTAHYNIGFISPVNHIWWINFIHKVHGSITRQSLIEVIVTVIQITRLKIWIACCVFSMQLFNELNRERLGKT